MGKDRCPGTQRREEVEKQKGFADRTDHGAVVWQWVQVGFRSPTWRRGAGLGSRGCRFQFSVLCEVGQWKDRK